MTRKSPQCDLYPHPHPSRNLRHWALLSACDLTSSFKHPRPWLPPLETPFSLQILPLVWKNGGNYFPNFYLFKRIITQKALQSLAGFLPSMPTLQMLFQCVCLSLQACALQTFIFAQTERFAFSILGEQICPDWWSKTPSNPSTQTLLRIIL